MKRILIFFIHITICMSLNGQTAIESIVHQFGSNLRDWCLTKDTDYRMRAQMLCTEACRVEDKIMRDFISENNLNLRNFVIQSYLNGFEAALDNGSITIELKGIESISPVEWALDKSTAQKKEKLTEDYAIFKCNIVVNGILNYDINDTYYLSKGLDAKIVKITPFEEIADQKTGEKKVKVDFSGLDKHIKSTNKKYPMQVSRGVVALKRHIEGNSLIYTYEVDSKLASFESMRNRAPKTKKTTLGMYCIEPALFNEAVMVIDCNMQIVERYVNKQTKESFDIEMTKEELIDNLYSIRSNNAEKIDLSNIIWKDIENLKKNITNYISGKTSYLEEDCLQIFLLQNEIDREYEKNMKMPVVTVSTINETIGTSKTTTKSIKKLPEYLRSINLSNVRVDISKLDVYLVDALDVRRASSYSNSFPNPYFIEHIFAKDSYILTDNKYILQERKKTSACIGRGRIFSGTFRAEDKLLTTDNILTIWGDIELKIYHK